MSEMSRQIMEIIKILIIVTNMSSKELRLMSYEIYNEVMKDIPHTHTEGDSDDFLGTQYSSVLDITPSILVDNFRGKDENSLKYSDRSDPCEESVETGDRFQNTYDESVKQELASLRVQTQLLKTSIARIKIKKNGYQELHQTIQTLQSQLDVLQKQVLLKDSSIQNLHNKEQRLQQQLKISQFRVRQLQKQTSKYQADIIQLHQVILDSNSRGSLSLREKELELIQKQRLIEEYLKSNRELMDQGMILKRQRDILKDQLEKQHKLILGYQKRGNEGGSGNKSRCNSKFRGELKGSFDTIRKQLVEAMKYMNRQLEEVKTSIAQSIISFAKECSTKLHALQIGSIENQKSNNERVQLFKKEILKLKMELVEGQICGESKPLHRTDPKPQVPVNRASQAPSISSLFNSTQPTKLLKRHIMNAGKHINVIVTEDRVLKELPTERKSIQECHFLKPKKK